MGATIIVLGAQGVPGFPKFNCTDPDGWASVLTTPAVITQAAAKALNFLCLISFKSSKRSLVVPRPQTDVLS